MTNKNSKKLEELALLHELRRQQLASVLSQQQFVSTQMWEHQQARQAIESFGKKKEGDEILVPFGAGVHAFAKITKAKQILVGVGASLSIEKTPEGAIKTLDERIEELEKESDKLSEVSQQVKTEVDKISAEIEATYKKAEE
ncbi:MAG TPA: prefoldin subunit alpha [Thermoplasmata archaeon]|nr:prefoldin subunit alpha [Thermoplasmata archaeon]HIH98480.1 prefoldin subunit alpha [Thermoplasmata archaeon]